MAEDNAATDWYADEVATFGDRLAAARRAEGLTKTDLARKIGVKPKTIRGWEDDRAEPRANKLQMLAGLLGVSLVWLLTGEGEGVNQPTQEAAELSEDRALLQEVRSIKLQMSRSADQLARLEKSLRKRAERQA